MFDMNPEQDNATFPVDNTYVPGIKIFNIAIMKLPYIFDGGSKSVNLFNEKLSKREKKSGWMDTGSNIIIPKDADEIPSNIIT